MSDDQKIYALWFDRQGMGPDCLRLQLHPFSSEMDGAIPASLSIRVMVDENNPVMMMASSALMIDGGLNLSKETAAELHRQLGAWLESVR